MKLAIGSDHSAFDLKQYLIAHLKNAGHEIIDVGCFSKDSVDYPDLAAAVAHKVIARDANLGIMLDGAGVGSCMAANKISGIRAALCNDLYTARNAREHNDANLLLLGSMVVGPGKAAQIAELFLSTQFQGGRHQRRIDKLMALEVQTPVHAPASTDSSTISDLVRRVLTAVQPTPTGTGLSAGSPTPSDKNPTRPEVITEDWLRAKIRTGVRSIKIPVGSLITPLAKDYIKDQHIQIEY